MSHISSLRCIYWHNIFTLYRTMSFWEIRWFYNGYQHELNICTRKAQKLIFKFAFEYSDSPRWIVTSVSYIIIEGFSACPSTSPLCNRSQKTLWTFGSGHHFKHVTVLLIMRRFTGSCSGLTFGMKMQMMIFSPLSNDTCTRK